jgi:DNA polymerase III subunit alpha
VLAQTERRKLTAEHYFKPRAEMLELFADLPEALDNTVEIARRVSYRPHTRASPSCRASPRSPASPRKRGRRRGRAAAVEAHAGLKSRSKYGMAAGQSVADYEERLEFELGSSSR